MLVDATREHSMFSFMDNFSGYNQIKIDPYDIEKIAFQTQIDTFHYTVMLFGLKNAGSTYHRTMSATFHDMLHDVTKIRLTYSWSLGKLVSISMV